MAAEGDVAMVSRAAPRYSGPASAASTMPSISPHFFTAWPSPSDRLLRRRSRTSGQNTGRWNSREKLCVQSIQRSTSGRALRSVGQSVRRHAWREIAHIGVRLPQRKPASSRVGTSPVGSCGVFRLRIDAMLHAGVVCAGTLRPSSSPPQRLLTLPIDAPPDLQHQSPPLAVAARVARHEVAPSSFQMSWRCQTGCKSRG